MSAAAACGVPVGPTGLERGQARGARACERERGCGPETGARASGDGRRRRSGSGRRRDRLSTADRVFVPKNSNHKPRTPEPEKRVWSAEVLKNLPDSRESPGIWWL